MVDSLAQPLGGPAPGHDAVGVQKEAMLKSEGLSSRKKTWENYLGYHAAL
jgi:hypothetical protein